MIENSGNQTEQKHPLSACLVVDDIPMNVKLLGGMLKKMGVESTLVYSAEAALEMMKEKKFDFILTDLWMPKMNGAQLAAQIRQDPQYRDLPIIAITADAEYQKSFEMSYFNGVMVKPVYLEELVQKLLDLNVSVWIEKE